MNSVHSLELFGAFSILVCPNLVIIRTPSLFFRSALSESSYYSDSFSVFSLHSVRIQLLFGLLFRFFAPLCPNPAIIRTPSSFFRSTLSESSYYSDSLFFFSLHSVRIQLLFGLLLCFFASLCPNPAIIRTPSLFFRSVLSESSYYSDSLFVFSLHSVRMMSLFLFK